VRVAILSGGVGGARFVRGVVEVAGGAAVSVVGNVGDDVEVLGLHVSPDLDSILYALAGLNDEQRGWGRAGETWEALETVRELGGEAWFALGDRDLGLHLVRTQALRDGEPLSAVTARLVAALGVDARLFPATDDWLRTWIDTPAGSFPFQEWFVARGHRDEVDGVRFEGGAEARPAPGTLEALAGADLLLLAPSNPYVSLGPILAVRELREALAARRVPCVAVSPLIGGRAVRGPADRMLARLGGGTSPRHVAGCYEGLVDAIVVDESDADDLGGLGDVRPIVTRTLMSDADARRRLAEVVLGAGRAAGQAADARREDRAAFGGPGAVPA
jgi:LPPG:FO 2-phospho-L-lactate transferase